MNKYNFGTGRRKSAIAQARITKGSGKVTINSKESLMTDLEFKDALYPFFTLSMEKAYDLSVIVKGGGVESQKDAIKLAVSRALAKENNEFEIQLKKESLLSRDPREKERKKPGLKRARRAPQWAKR